MNRRTGRGVRVGVSAAPFARPAMWKTSLPLVCVGVWASLAGCSSDEGPKNTGGGDAAAAGVGEESPAELEPLLLVGRPVTGDDAVRPKVRVDVRDDSEHFGLDQSELYLTVQSSRFNANCLVVLPLNVGEFRGVRERYVELPFAVAAGDTLTFNLLDDSTFSSDSEAALTAACRVAGYAVVMSATIFQPELASAVPAGGAAGALTGRSLGAVWRNDNFTHVAAADYRVPDAMPASDRTANRVSLRDGTYTPADVRVFAAE